MPAFLEKYTQQLKDFWGNLEKKQRVRICVVSVAAAIVMIIFIVVVTRPDRMTLYQSEDKKQVGEMSDVLSERGIWNKVENGGTSILIDSKNNDTAQVTLAQAGYPKDGTTFEDAISYIGLTTTDSDKKRIWKQQQVSEIEDKIKMLDNIDNATVRLAVPEKSIFYSNEQAPAQPTATVTIWSNDRLLPRQVDGIKLIVAGSVEEMPFDNIRVLDNLGNPLEGTVENDPMDAIMTYEQLRKSRAIELQNNVYTLFGLGKNEFFDNLSVVASPRLDFDTLESTRELIGTPEGYDPGTGAVLEEHLRRETAENYAVGGVPGMDTNPGETTPIYPMGGYDGVGNYSLNETQRAYGYDRTIENSTKNLGELIPSQSFLSVLLGYGIDIEDDTHLDEEYLNGIRQQASTATGIPAQNITVTTIKLMKDVVPPVPIGDRIQAFLSEYGLLILMLLLIVTLILSLLQRREAEEEVEDLQLQIAEGIIEPEEPVYRDIDVDEKSEIRNQLERLIKQKPEAVAALLRNWLSDEWE